MSRQSFQQGTLVKLKRKIGFVWVLRYRVDGIQKAITIGTNADYPTESDARKKVIDLLPTLNTNVKIGTFGQLIQRYLDHISGEVRVHTIKNYQQYGAVIARQYGDASPERMFQDLDAIRKWLMNTTGMRGERLSYVSIRARPYFRELIQRAELDA